MLEPRKSSINRPASPGQGRGEGFTNFYSIPAKFEGRTRRSLFITFAACFPGSPPKGPIRVPQLSREPTRVCPRACDELRTSSETVFLQCGTSRRLRLQAEKRPEPW